MEPELLIPLAAISLPILLVPTVMSLKSRQRRREFEHLERMKAMEMGTTPGHLSGPWSGRSIAAIGAGVPMASMFAAWLTSFTVQPDFEREIPFTAIVWGSSSLVSLFGLTTSLILGALQSRASRSSFENSNHVASFKPSYDPDAFDVVGSRG